MRVADLIFQRLKTETDVVFFVPGGLSMFLVDALGRSGIQAVSGLHEQGCGAMALGYAMATGKLGVVLTIGGPGATNAITPCLAAWTDSIPVLFISGQCRTELLTSGDLRTHGAQPGPIIEMVSVITKWSCEAKDGGECLDMLEFMIGDCLEGRKGPCWLSVPQDVQAMEVER